MAGGYHEYDTADRRISSFPTYRFMHWDLIDTFIYFSHHFVTIPPSAWISIAHKYVYFNVIAFYRNGVKVYGTVIIERDRVNPCPQFDQIFGVDTDEAGLSLPVKFAQKLNDIRLNYRFEGWLINFENRFFDVGFVMFVHYAKFMLDFR